MGSRLPILARAGFELKVPEEPVQNNFPNWSVGKTTRRACGPSQFPRPHRIALQTPPPPAQRDGENQIVGMSAMDPTGKLLLTVS